MNKMYHGNFQLLSPHHSKPAMSRGEEGLGMRGLEGVGGVKVCSILHVHTWVFVCEGAG